MCRRERKTALHFAESSTGAAESFVSNVVFPGYYWSGPCKSRRVAHRGVTIYRAESIAHRTINPERTMSVQPNHVEEVEKSWAKVAALGVENVGVLLFKNIFTVAPEALELFSFKNEPDLYDSPKLKAHGANVVSTVGKAVAACESSRPWSLCSRRSGRGTSGTASWSPTTTWLARRCS